MTYLLFLSLSNVISVFFWVRELMFCSSEKKFNGENELKALAKKG